MAYALTRTYAIASTETYALTLAKSRPNQILILVAHSHTYVFEYDSIQERDAFVDMLRGYMSRNRNAQLVKVATDT